MAVLMYSDSTQKLTARVVDGALAYCWPPCRRA